MSTFKSSSSSSAATQARKELEAILRKLDIDNHDRDSDESLSDHADSAGLYGSGRNSNLVRNSNSKAKPVLGPVSSQSQSNIENLSPEELLKTAEIFLGRAMAQKDTYADEDMYEREMNSNSLSEEVQRLKSYGSQGSNEQYQCNQNKNQSLNSNLDYEDLEMNFNREQEQNFLRESMMDQNYNDIIDDQFNVSQSLSLSQKLAEAALNRSGNTTTKSSMKAHLNQSNHLNNDHNLPVSESEIAALEKELKMLSSMAKGKVLSKEVTDPDSESDGDPESSGESLSPDTKKKMVSKARETNIDSKIEQYQLENALFRQEIANLKKDIVEKTERNIEKLTPRTSSGINKYMSLSGSMSTGGKTTSIGKSSSTREEQEKFDFQDNDDDTDSDSEDQDQHSAKNLEVPNANSNPVSTGLSEVDITFKKAMEKIKKLTTVEGVVQGVGEYLKSKDNIDQDLDNDSEEYEQDPNESTTVENHQEEMLSLSNRLKDLLAQTNSAMSFAGDLQRRVENSAYKAEQELESEDQIFKTKESSTNSKSEVSESMTNFPDQAEFLRNLIQKANLDMTGSANQGYADESDSDVLNESDLDLNPYVRGGIPNLSEFLERKKQYTNQNSRLTLSNNYNLEETQSLSDSVSQSQSDDHSSNDESTSSTKFGIPIAPKLEDLFNSINLRPQSQGQLDSSESPTQTDTTDTLLASEFQENMKELLKLQHENARMVNDLKEKKKQLLLAENHNDHGNDSEIHETPNSYHNDSYNFLSGLSEDEEDLLMKVFQSGSWIQDSKDQQSQKLSERGSFNYEDLKEESEAERTCKMAAFESEKLGMQRRLLESAILAKGKLSDSGTQISDTKRAAMTHGLELFREFEEEVEKIPHPINLPIGHKMDNLKILRDLHKVSDAVNSKNIDRVGPKTESDDDDDEDCITNPDLDMPGTNNIDDDQAIKFYEDYMNSFDLNSTAKWTGSERLSKLLQDEDDRENAILKQAEDEMFEKISSNRNRGGTDSTESSGRKVSKQKSGFHRFKEAFGENLNHDYDTAEQQFTKSLSKDSNDSANYSNSSSNFRTQVSQKNRELFREQLFKKLNNSDTKKLNDNHSSTENQMPHISEDLQLDDIEDMSAFYDNIIKANSPDQEEFEIGNQYESDMINQLEQDIVDSVTSKPGPKSSDPKLAQLQSLNDTMQALMQEMEDAKRQAQEKDDEILEMTKLLEREKEVEMKMKDELEDIQVERKKLGRDIQDNSNVPDSQVETAESKQQVLENSQKIRDLKKDIESYEFDLAEIQKLTSQLESIPGVDEIQQKIETLTTKGFDCFGSTSTSNNTSSSAASAQSVPLASPLARRFKPVNTMEDLSGMKDYIGSGKDSNSKDNVAATDAMKINVLMQKLQRSGGGRGQKFSEMNQN